MMQSSDLNPIEILTLRELCINKCPQTSVNWSNVVHNSGPKLAKSCDIWCDPIMKWETDKVTLKIITSSY